MIYHFIPGPEHDSYEYWRGLSALWDTDHSIVNIEHDMEVSVGLVAGLLSCPRPLCSHAYRMHVPRDYWAHGHWPESEGERLVGSGINWIDEGDPFAGYSAIGFCKITPEARIAPLERVDWRGCELAVNHAVRGPWHIHWPAINHYHTKDGQRIVERY